jgi:hypothetical protein
MLPLSFGTLAVPGPTELDLCCYLASIREFGGPQADAPLLVGLPEGIGPLTGRTRSYLTAIGAQIVPVTIPREVLEFPLGAKVTAAAELERICPTRTLFFTDRDALLLQPPADLTFGDEPRLHYRPVHHRLIGQRWKEEPDAFWLAVYRECGVSIGCSESTYAALAASGDLHLTNAMRTHLGEEIAPYINGGCIAVDCERGIMERWDEVFRVALSAETFRGFFADDQRHALFLHQALLTGIILAHCDESDTHLLSPAYNYPLHLHDEVPPNDRPHTLDDLVLARTEDLLHTGEWRSHGLVRNGDDGGSDITGWLKSQVQKFS